MEFEMSKSNLLIMPIIQYVTSKVSQAGETPQLLPGEPDLCKKFGVARGTVRRAMAYLIERGIVIQLPKRRGYFSNPKYSNSGEINIGVLSGSGYFAAMSHLASDMYSGFLQGIKPLYCLFQFLNVSSCDPETIADLIEYNGLKALLWLCPEDEGIPAFNSLLKKSIPLVAIENAYVVNHIHPERNFLLYDQVHAGELRAEQVLDSGFHKPLYCAERGKVTDAFAQYLNRNGGVCKPEDILSTEEIPVRIDPQKNLSGFDCIVCDGDRKRYSMLLNQLQQHPDGKKVKVFLEKEINSEDIIPDFPDLDIEFIRSLDMRTTAFNAGKRAGLILRGILTKRKAGSFESEFFR